MSRAQQAGALFAAGQLDQARARFVALANEQPGDARWLLAIGACALRQDRPREAIAPLEQACALATVPPRAWLYLALARQRAAAPRAADALEQAERMLEHPADLQQVAQAWLAGGHPERARRLAEGPLRDRAGGFLILAQLARREGDAARAVTELGLLLQGPHDEEQAQAALGELGHALDGLGRSGAAWRCFSARNAIARGRCSIDMDAYPRHLAELETAWAHGLPATRPPLDDGPVPVFLVGFPRSGTTLTEQILARHAQVHTLDERPVLARLIAGLPTLLGRPFSYPRDLDGLTEIERLQLRHHYRNQAGISGDGVFLDKLPLNWPHLPMIRTLFPECVVLTLLRDPRDACLSAWMQDFAPNEAMVQFLVPGRTAAMYAAVRRMDDRFTASGALQTHRVHYEELVRTPEKMAQTLFTALALPWDAAVLDPDGQQGRYVSTPSRLQVCRPIHTRSIGRHTRYPQFVAAIGATAPWWPGISRARP